MPGVLQHPGHLVGAVLGAGEHDDPAERVVLQHGQQQRLLAGLRQVMDELLDLRRGLFLAGDFHADRVAQQAVGQAGDLGRHGGREQAGLTLRRQRGDDAADVLDEAQVEHPVGLIQHELADGAELQFAGLHQVADAAGRADDDVGAAAHRLDLLEAAGTADDHHGAQARQVDRQGADGFVDLQRQFAGRRQDQRAGRRTAPDGPGWAARCCRMGRVKAAVLPLPVWAMPSRSWPASKCRDGIGLDRGRDRELARFEGTQKRLGQAEGRESSLGQDVVMLQRPSRLWERKALVSSSPRAIKWGRTVFRWKFPELRTKKTAR